MGGKPDHDHTTALPFVCDMSLSAADTPHAAPPPPSPSAFVPSSLYAAFIAGESALQTSPKQRGTPPSTSLPAPSLTQTTCTANRHEALAGVLPPPGTTPLETNPRDATATLRNRRRRHLFSTPPGRLFLHPTPSSSALLQPATSCPQSTLINKSVNDRSRDLVLGPAGQTSVPPLLSATTSPARSNYAAVAIPSMLPPRSSILYSCTPFARHAALASEPKNAFTACAGIKSTCSMCDLAHCGTLSVDPSPTLLKHSITKAWADRKRATAATPWPSKTGYTRLCSQPNSPPYHGRTRHVRRRLLG